ncbi:helix-turn-helix domain-containing protein [Marinifilum flexuosum]|uniref:helix-turn-helix domain-containing protein n=1 Tax=Marinifilum flexuosum TaxID=1117708 RepID=UPI002492E669|nr:helix-turn-helix domain-containing protein [Marinifilum flexuosum]
MKIDQERVPINLQKRIKDELKKQKISLSSMARKLNISSVSLFQLLERSTMQVDRLWTICLALDINLFQEIANHLDGKAYNPALEEKDKEIEVLEHKIKDLENDVERLKTERDCFKEAISLLKT